jgi:hypothetical protein
MFIPTRPVTCNTLGSWEHYNETLTQSSATRNEQKVSIPLIHMRTPHDSCIQLSVDYQNNWLILPFNACYWIEVDSLVIWWLISFCKVTYLEYVHVQISLTNYTWCLTFQSLAVTLRTIRFNIKKFHVVPTLRLCVLYGSQNKSNFCLIKH